MTKDYTQLKRLAEATTPGQHHIYTHPRDEALLADLERVEAEIKRMREQEPKPIGVMWDADRQESRPIYSNCACCDSRVRGFHGPNACVWGGKS